jgi:hypothetical protein
MRDANRNDQYSFAELVLCQNSFVVADLAFRGLGSWSVFADQAAKNLSSLDPCGDVDGVGGLALRGLLLKALVRAVAVVVRGVLGQDVAKVLLAEDQHVAGALTAKRSARGPGMGPFLPYQAPVPGQQGARRHDPVQPEPLGQQTGKGGDHGAVSPV